MSSAHPLGRFQDREIEDLPYRVHRRERDGDGQALAWADRHDAHGGSGPNRSEEPSLVRSEKLTPYYCHSRANEAKCRPVMVLQTVENVTRVILHLFSRPQEKTHALHPSLQSRAQTGEMGSSQSSSQNHYGFTRYSPLEFLARVLIHIPERDRHLVHLHGAYANRLGRTYLHPIRQEDQPREQARPSTNLRAANKRWRELIYRIDEVDPLTCPRCGAERKVLAFITEHEVIKRILDHRDTTAAAARAPPLQNSV
jgi:hypothetical protein